MSTGTVFRTSFQSRAKGLSGEVPLFRAFIQAFNALGKDSISKEFHGNKYQVKFASGRGAGRPIPRCELCDVAIIQYQAGYASSARITFNQAKVTSRNLGCGAISSGISHYRFSANLEQWDLLSNRPLLNQAVSTFLPPKTLLAAAALPSAGSFGVFYPSKGTFDYAYFVADGLHPITNNEGRTGVLYLKTPMFTKRNVRGFDELSGTCCLSTFGDALDAGLIGTPIFSLINTNTAQGRDLRSWFAGLIKGLQQDYPDSDIPRELLSGLELGQVSDRFGEDDIRHRHQLKTVVVIRTNTNVRRP